MNKKVIYTAITGEYDNLLPPIKITEGWNYICFTNNPNLKSKHWEIKLLSNYFLNGFERNIYEDDPVRLARKVKILSYEFIPCYEISVWVDGNVQVNCNLDQFIYDNFKKRYSIVGIRHSERNCIYKEADACMKLSKDSVEMIKNQMEHYKYNGYPTGNGLFQTGVLIRPQLLPYERSIMKKWWSQAKNWSRRDQLSFEYVVWQNKELGPFSVKYLDIRDVLKGNFIKKFHKISEFGGKIK